MMILTDFYRFERVAIKAKSRLDCVFSTQSYPEFESRTASKEQKETLKFDATKVGDIVVYYNNVPLQFGGDVHKKADKNLTIKGENLSSIFVPDVTKKIGFGDFKGTQDALLFIFHNFEVVNGIIQKGGFIDVFVARGKSKDRVKLLSMLDNGELDNDMHVLKEKAVLTERGGEVITLRLLQI